jgi:ABC-2 type transport system ATP-binding protein
MDYYVCELKGISKAINGTQILQDLSFSIRKGRVTAMLGPNGSGKTSSIRVILGLLNPDSGEVWLFNQLLDRKKIRGKIGLLPQSNSGYKQLTVIENLKFMIKLAGIDFNSIQEELFSLLERLDMKHLLKQKFGTLSGGESRALGLIRTVLTGSEFLILDEPTTGLDIARAAEIRKIIQEQINLGKTVLMSSHIVSDLEGLAQDIIIIKDGTVDFSGEKQEVIDSYSPDGTLEDAIISAFTKKEVVNHV